MRAVGGGLPGHQRTPPNIERTVHKIRIREYWVHLLRMLQHFGVFNRRKIVNNLVNTYSIGCPHIFDVIRKLAYLQIRFLRQ